jgi:hypothetical protein
LTQLSRISPEKPMIRALLALGLANLGGYAAATMQARVADPIPDVLRGRALEIVDQRGTTRARINVASDGEVVLRLLDRHGTIRVKLGAGTDGSGLLLANDATEPGVHLLATREGSRIRVAESNGRERVIEP